ncbi:MAG: carboxypeptidase-like regulatory domain-containing protein [Allosphingosinicella sp.]
MRDLRVSFPRPCDEEWEAMMPAGCGRICARCDKVIHDLSQYELSEAEALLRRDPDTCVRATIGPDGVVALKPARAGSGARRMVIAAAATVGMLGGGAAAFAKAERPGGAIAGKVEAYAARVRVTATGPAGHGFQAKVKRNGRFRIEGVPAGTYRLTFVPDCGESWTVENVVVNAGETIVPESQNSNGCITVGMLRIGDDKA